MDVTAISSATCECLSELGLRAKGDVFALKAFCNRRQLTSNTTSKNAVDGEKTNYDDRKRKLLELLQKGNQKKRNQSAEKHSSSTISKGTVEKYKTRKISLGWLHYSEEKERFVAVRLNSGGGTRRLDVGSHFSKEMLIEEGKKLFYPNSESSQGHADDMMFDLANFKGESIEIPDDEVNKQSFTVQKYIEINKLTQVRLYLTTRRTPIASLDVNNVSRECADEGTKISTSDVEEIIEESESEDDDEVLMNPVFNCDTTLTGSTEERRRLIEEQDRVFQESLDNDRREENEISEANETEENEKERLQQLMQARLERVPPEPNPDLPRVRIAVNHISMGKIVRSFSDRDNMQAVYDWVGSCSIHPEHFNLSQCQGQTIMPSDPVVNVANCTLYMEVSTSPVQIYGHQEMTSLASNNDVLSNTTM